MLPELPILLAQRSFDPGFLIYIAIIVASIIGGILQKSKGDKKDDKRTPIRREPGPTARPVPRPRADSGSATAPRPTAQRSPRPVERPGTPPRREASERMPFPTERARQQADALDQPAPRPSPIASATPVELPPEPERLPPLVTTRRPVAVIEGGDRETAKLRQSVHQMTRSPADLRAALVLSEILGRPLALRNNDAPFER